MRCDFCHGVPGNVTCHACRGTGVVSCCEGAGGCDDVAEQQFVPVVHWTERRFPKSDAGSSNLPGDATIEGDTKDEAV